jgi:glyceraldehyde 3-phosphate dehydrogenase
MKAPHEIEVAAVNDLGDPEALARLLARDSVHGHFPEPISLEHDKMMVGAMAVTMLMEPNADSLPWRELGIDVVIECTGRFTSREMAATHLRAGAKRVIVSAPAKGVDATFVIGVNEDTFDPQRDFVVSNASCTTNCLAVLVKVLDDAFGVEEGFMTTVHAYTDDQHLVDALHKDPRRARGGAINIIPTTTGAARATGLVVPDVAGRLDGLSLRVPVPDGSVTDLVANLRESPTVTEICDAYGAAAEIGRLAGVLEYSEDDLVSTDIVGSSASCIFDSKLTMASGHLVKVLGWYDNETGYAHRLVDLATVIGGTSEHYQTGSHPTIVC